MRGRNQRDRKSGNNNFNNNKSANNDNRKKSTGCKQGLSKENNPWISGWNKQKGRFLSILAYPYKGTHITMGQGPGGHEWHNWMAKVKMNGVEVANRPCLYDATTGKVIIEWIDEGIVMNPKAPNGGYCGTVQK